MGKMLLSAILLVLVVGVSYIEAVRRQGKVDNSFQIGVKSGQNADIAVARDITITEIGKKPVPVVSVLSTADISAAVHREILAYYKKRCELLPENLIKHKRHRAILQIRRETAVKYSITVSELNHIRDFYKITY